MTLRLSPWLGRVLRFSLFEPRGRKPRSGNIHEVGNCASELLSEKMQHLKGRIPQASLNLRVVPERDARDLLLSEAG